MGANHSPAKKLHPRKARRALRLLVSVLDPRAYLHLFKMINYYNYSHVQPMRRIEHGPGLEVSPDAVFSNPERIKLGARVQIGSRCHLWAGHAAGTITVGNDVLFGPEVMMTAATYRYNDGQPVTQQLMDEADIVIGNDVWFGTRAIVLAGARIGDGAIIAADAIVRDEIPPMSIAAGQPARVVGARKLSQRPLLKSA
jgi:acetyltransferase-like isoleucine patch superfamily enzyme